MDTYEQQLLDGWEEVYKKGQLTLWIMLALKHHPMHMAQIKQFIEETTMGALTADDKSLYRALRRYYDSEMVEFTTRPGDGGPDRKVYKLTPIGQKVLRAFIERNISGIFYQASVRELIERS